MHDQTHDTSRVSAGWAVLVCLCAGVAAARLPRAGHPPPDGTGGHLPSARGPLCGALQGGRGGPRAGIARVRRVEEHSGGRKGARGG